MCGITGVLHVDGGPVSADALQRMTDIVRHRGPDGEGQWLAPGIGLGHRRLAILDLSSAGQQPMPSSDGALVITYNGEIYNWRELREALRREGAVFRSNTDTEVVLEAYRVWGDSCVERFNGMFAFAVWDVRCLPATAMV